MDEFISAEKALVVMQAVADHLIDTIARLGAAAGIHAAAPDSGSIDQRIQQATQPILAEWRHRGLGDGIVFSGRTLPAPLALGILSLELVVHGWDFAVALHRPIDMSDVHAAQVLGLARQTLTAQSRATAGFDHPCRCRPTRARSSGSSRSPAATQCR